MYDFEIKNKFKNCLHFIGVFPRDKLPSKFKRPCGFIVNLDKSGEPGSHWIAIIMIANDRGEYFDSFGLPPLKEDIRKFLNKNCKEGWIYNPVALQHPFSTSCGNYCVAYLKNRFENKTFIKFLNSFSVSRVKNEKILSSGLEKRWFHRDIQK